MHILPFQLILILRFPLVGLMPYGEDTEAVQILGNIKHAPDHRISSSGTSRLATP